MAVVDSVLCLQVGKCIFNFLPFLCLRKVHNQVSFISLLLLSVTDTMITGFLLCLWIGGYSTEGVYLRFLAFQNNTYQTIILLLPWLCISEEWSRLRINQRGGKSTTKTILSMQSRLLSLACWLFAASYNSKNPLLIFLETSPECETWDWRCPFTYLNEEKYLDWLLPSIGLVLGTTLFYSSTGNGHPVVNSIIKKGKTQDNVMFSFLLVSSTGASLIFLPPFMAVSSWTIIAIDKLSRLLQRQMPEPLITVYNTEGDIQIMIQTSDKEKVPLTVTRD
ncbi:uncharacterized protein PAF06_004202 [Gastrophryne carolinensis]